MLVALEPGLPVAGSALAARMAHVSERTAVWWLGWLVWHAADFSLLAFYVPPARRQGHVERQQRKIWLVWHAADFSLLLAGAGLADDLGAQVVYMAVAPRLGPEAFVVAEAVAGVLTGYVANGLYTVAGLLLVWAGARELPCYLVALSLPE